MGAPYYQPFRPRNWQNWQVKFLVIAQAVAAEDKSVLRLIIDKRPGNYPLSSRIA
jgi:hypothetical protein